MGKSEKSKEKDHRKSKETIWVDDPVRYENRRSGSGVKFGGHYEDVRGDK